MLLTAQSTTKHRSTATMQSLLASRPAVMQIRSAPLRQASSRRTLTVAASRQAQALASAAAVAEAPPAVQASGPDYTVPSPTPAEMDIQRGFRIQPTVELWKTFTAPSTEELQSKGLANVVSEFLASAREEVRSADEAAYWAYHTARTLFFMTQGGASLVLQAIRDRSAPRHPLISTMSVPEVFYRLSMESLVMFRQDLSNIRAGNYNLPYDMDRRHRQFRTRFVLNKAATYLNESSRVLERRNTAEPDKVWMSSNLIPEYYQSTWHYQSDGWLSSGSARAYDALTETLFVGRQDSMQRATIPPLKEHFAGRDTNGLKVLDAACGTGRVATFIRDNLPGSHVTALDLSPFYLEEARSINREWRVTKERLRGTGAGSASFVMAPVEKMPFPDGHFDAVTCVYLFHELPVEKRIEAARELSRVLKPGGVLVLTDSNQYGDRPAGDKGLPNFQQFNEPNYGTYIRTDLGGLFVEQGGLVPWRKDLASASKVLAFKKPLSGHDSAHAAPAAAAAMPGAAMEMPSDVLSDSEVASVGAAAAAPKSAEDA